MQLSPALAGQPLLHDFDSQPLSEQFCFRSFEEHDVFLVVLSNDRQAVVSDRVQNSERGACTALTPLDS